MRIFVGIPLHGDTRERIVDIQANFLPPTVRLSRPENLHVTLVPPWETEDPSAVSERLSRVRFSPFLLTFHKLVLMPHKHPHMAWLAGQLPHEITVLQESLLSVLDQENDRPLRMHTTLARFKTEQRFSLPDDVSIQILCRVEKFVLYRVDRFPSGSLFTILSTFPANTD